MYLTILDYSTSKVLVYNISQEEINYHDNDMEEIILSKYPEYKESNCYYLITSYLDINIKL